MATSMLPLRRPGILPILSHRELKGLSNAALKSRFRALQRMSGREPAHMLELRGDGELVPGIASKSSPQWREAYRDTKELLEERRRLVIPLATGDLGSAEGPDNARTQKDQSVN